MNRRLIYPVLQAVAAAALFGASAPLAKLLLSQMEPVPLAALLYLGSGFGLLLFRTVRRFDGPAAATEARLGRADLPWLAGAVVAGGIAAPIVLMFSLRITPAATASILLNFEAVATAAIAAVVFKEAIGRNAWVAVACITAGSTLLSISGSGEWGVSLGALGVLAACTLWGIDNNFTRNISAKDPVSIGMIKGLVAGAFSLSLAIVLGQGFPRFSAVVGALALGALSYGLSVVLFIFAMRHLGAGRTSALFGTAPFVGAVLSFTLFRETPGALFLIALPMMIAGVIALATEEHGHEHTHAAMAHEHRHCHDDPHHAHPHQAEDGASSDCHSHPHGHAPLAHSHPHAPDLHHRHEH